MDNLADFFADHRELKSVDRDRTVEVYQAFNVIGMTDDLAALLAAFWVTQCDLDAATNLLNYVNAFVEQGSDPR